MNGNDESQRGKDSRQLMCTPVYTNGLTGADNCAKVAIVGTQHQTLTLMVSC